LLRSLYGLPASILPPVPLLKNILMPRFFPAFVPFLVALGLAAPAVYAQEKPSFGPADWPWWRGPTRNGIANPNQQPPLTWSETENLLWKSPVAGRGHGAPIVVGDRVFLATADPDKAEQALVCFDRETGMPRWNKVIHKGGLTKAGNAKSSLASSTPACDGKRVFINFLNAEAIYTTALDLEGNRVWQTKVTDYVLHQGFGSSPAVYQGLVLVSADNKGKGVIAGLDRETGSIIWRRERPKAPNYASPILLQVAGREQLLMTGCDLVAGLDPATGDALWEIPGSTTETVTSTVTDGQIIFTSGGYPKNHISAVKADGSGKVVWENKSRVYVPSMLVSGGHLFAVQDDGVVVCWKCDSGAKVWSDRIDGAFSASPILVGDKIYATSEAGRTFVFKADPKKFELLAENKLGDNVLATAAICGGRVYIRGAVQKDGRRQEMLYCVGAK
jgi:outer membrane protein assembly factor BamB